MKFRRIFNDEDDARFVDLGAILCEDDSLTVEGPARDADINVLVKRYGIDKSGMPVAPIDPSAYGDLSEAPDLKTAMDRIRDANERFAALPASMRRRFNNDAAQLWDFVNDPQNGDESVSLGLLQREESSVVPTPVVP